MGKDRDLPARHEMPFVPIRPCGSGQQRKCCGGRRDVRGVEEVHAEHMLIDDD